jgi:hypothetical protein
MESFKFNLGQSAKGRTEISGGLLPLLLKLSWLINVPPLATTKADGTEDSFILHFSTRSCLNTTRSVVILSGYCAQTTLSSKHSIRVTSDVCSIASDKYLHWTVKLSTDSANNLRQIQ